MVPILHCAPRNDGSVPGVIGPMIYSAERLIERYEKALLACLVPAGPAVGLELTITAEGRIVLTEIDVWAPDKVEEAIDRGCVEGVLAGAKAAEAPSATRLCFALRR